MRQAEKQSAQAENYLLYEIIRGLPQQLKQQDQNHPIFYHQLPAAPIQLSWNLIRDPLCHDLIQICFYFLSTHQTVVQLAALAQPLPHF